MKSPVFFNCTPHPVNLVNDDGTVRATFEPSHQVRVDEKIVRIDEFFSRVEYGEVVGLPPVVEGVYLIVSRLVKSALPDRPDLVCPAELVRDARGNVIGCKSFSLN